MLSFINVWYFGVKADLCSLFSCFLSLLPLQIQLSRGILNTYLSIESCHICVPVSRPRFPKSYAIIIFCLQWYICMRRVIVVHFIFYIVWPLLFKLSFQNYLQIQFSYGLKNKTAYGIYYWREEKYTSKKNLLLHDL